MQRYFAVTVSSVYQMVLGLERRGLLRRTTGRARSLAVLVAPEALPALHSRNMMDAFAAGTISGDAANTTFGRVG